MPTPTERVPIDDRAGAVNYYDDYAFNTHERAYRAGYTEMEYEDRPASSIVRPDSGDMWSVEVSIYDGELMTYDRALTEPEATRLAERVNEAGTIDPEHWRHVRTLYGSPAWIRNGCDAIEAAREREEDRLGYY